MSNKDTINQLRDARERIERERERLFSPDLDAKIADYERLEAELEALGAEIAKLSGIPKPSDIAQNTGSEVSKKGKGRKKGGPRLNAEAVQNEVLKQLRQQASGVGLAGQTIASEILKTHPEIPKSTIYSKVMQFLNGQLAEKNPQVRKEGEKINTKWYSC